MQKLIDKQCFVDCEDIPENTAIFNLNTLSYRQGKTKLSQKQIKRIAFIIATDLKTLPNQTATFLYLQQMKFIHICNPINKTHEKK